MLLIGSDVSIACGPTFPNTMLDGGDAAVLAAPVADFFRELERMKLPAPVFQAYETTNSYAEQSLEADLSDLRTALKKAKVATKEKETILEKYRTERELARAQWESAPAESPDGEGKAERVPLNPEPMEMPESVPPEFVDYLRGKVAFHNGQTNEAREIWEKLLERPQAERHFRSTWAAYMLGRLCGTNETKKARQYYAEVRSLAKTGFADTLGLAAASNGWEAQMDLREKKFEKAIESYLQQYAAGDSSAGLSLKFAASQALVEDASVLGPLAKNPRIQKVITAYVIAEGRPGPRLEENEQPGVRNWLSAVEAVGARDVESAELLALAAYQNGQMDVAQRWINRARNSPAAQWLQAKLLLRAGKVDRAAALLARVTKLFPIEAAGTNETAKATFEESLYMNFGSDYWPEGRPAAKQVLAELGVIHLARREYREALDALLRSGYWADAAYVADRVLTVDELKSYVDQQWPALEPQEVAVDSETNEVTASVNNGEANPSLANERIRYLLGRRLTRSCRGLEARAYFPAKFQARYDALMQTLTAGRDETIPVPARAKALFEAAKIVRSDGMELVGTELGPDWHVSEGGYQNDFSEETRLINSTNQVLTASKDELLRCKQHKTDPEARYHYRYQAAFISWEAARLMPNNSEETAKALWSAGVWLKNRDPQTADIFYKALVRRCRKTALGEEADRIRWFPELDAEGNIIPGKDRRTKHIVEPTILIQENTADNVPETESTSDAPPPS
jgi:hypothetical protein